MTSRPHKIAPPAAGLVCREQGILHIPCGESENVLPTLFSVRRDLLDWKIEPLQHFESFARDFDTPLL